MGTFKNLLQLLPIHSKNHTNHKRRFYHYSSRRINNLLLVIYLLIGLFIAQILCGKLELKSDY